MPKHLVSNQNAEEFRAFGLLTESIRIAGDSCKAIAALRNDQRWEIVAATLDAMLQQIYDLVGDGAPKGGQN